MMLCRFSFSVIAALALLMLMPTSSCWALKPEWCEKHLSFLASQMPQSGESAPRLETVDDMLWAFSNGLVPDPENAAQLRAFEVYLTMRFGKPENVGNIKSVVESIAAQLKKHPELAKEPFRNFLMTSVERSYPVTEDLTQFMKTPVEAAGQVRGNLFQVEANLGFWKRLLNWEEAKPEAGISKEKKREFIKAEKERFLKRLNELLPFEFRQELANSKSKLTSEEKAKQLFAKLSEQRTKMVLAKEDVSVISRAMVDLVHTIGFADKEVYLGLKSEDGLKRIAALRRAMDHRDQFAMALGFTGHFEQVLKDLNIVAPTGLASNIAFLRVMGEVEQGVIAKALMKASENSQKEIRQLSLMEAPFRSCIGGWDCSTMTYLTKALDPNYQYFTLTDTEGHSSGHVTVVLGSVPGSRTESKIAFIDKIQNVPHEDLPIMLEAMRRSFEEKGYVLGLPEDLVLPEEMGEHAGISNDITTIEFVKRWIKTKNETLTGFKPTPHQYAFENKYSRAYKRLSIRPVAPLELPEHVKLSPLQEAYAWRTRELDLQQLVAGSRDLKHGSTEDKTRYIEAQKTIKTAGLEKDPEFKKTIEAWLADTQVPFGLRKRVLHYKWLEEGGALAPLLSHLTPSERIVFLQNCLDTPRFRDEILKKKNQLPALLVQVRANKKLVATLGESFSKGNSETIEKVLAAKDLPDARALAALSLIKTSFSSQNMTDATAILREVAGTSVEAEVGRGLLEAYVTNVASPTRLTREVVRYLGHENSATSRFTRAVLETQASLGMQNPMMVAVQQIEQRAHQRGVDHRRAAEEWLSDPGQSISLKGEYLRAHLTALDLENLRSKIPKNQKVEVSRILEEKSNALVFRSLAETQRIAIEELAHWSPEAFDYIPFRFPKGGQKVTLGSPPDEPGRRDNEVQSEVILTKAFEMQATPVTQAQWALVMGNNPSHFKGDNPLMINGIAVDPNRPVEQVSWNDVQEFIKKLNTRDSQFSYRLPTEAEWEFSARAGSNSRYSFGGSEEDLPQYGWYLGNSGKMTHPVAELKPNASGIYDMHGNVMEWMQDGYTERPPSGVNPIASSGSGRVLRGGGWSDYAQDLRSAERGYGDPNSRSGFVGFRLVRTPK